METLVVQELSEDFVSYVQERDFEPSEITFDKATKKDLLEAIDQTLGDTENYYDV